MSQPSPSISPSSHSRLKRTLDVGVASVALAVSVPVICLFAAAVRLDSRGGSFFTQQRLGKDGRKFTIYKLRSMHIDAEADGTPRLSCGDDPRITRVGRFMRRYRIDELPQLWNVIRGDMSLVGPRPEREYFALQVRRSFPSYLAVMNVRPGLTSAGMLRYGYADSVERMVERARLDVEYMKHSSLMSDTLIFLKSIIKVLGGKLR